ncbi:MAG: hypothetical protein RLZZ592_2776 [Pseudomonadota bacterium]|jgi:uncharacterized protein YidB (DUF937 family)
MGLLDSLVGSVVSQALGGTETGRQAALVQALISMLMRGGLGAPGAASSDAPHSGAEGLGALLEQFQRSGLGDVVASWISTGRNLPVSGEQIGQVLGPDVLGQLARSAGMDSSAAGGALAQILPQVVDAMTPQGRLPQPGTDLGAMLPQILGGLLGGAR